MTLGERIKEIRKESKLTQAALAEKIGVKQNSIALFETDKRNPSNQTILSLCRLLHVNEEWLRCGSGEKYTAEYELLSKEAREARLRQEDVDFILAYIRLPEANRTVLRDCLATLCGGKHES